MKRSNLGGKEKSNISSKGSLVGKRGGRKLVGGGVPEFTPPNKGEGSRVDHRKKKKTLL